MGNLRQSTIVTFWTLVGVFLVVLCHFFIPLFRDLLKGSELFFIPMAVFCLLGVVLLILSLKEKAKGKLKKFLILTGASAVGLFVFVILHNVFYALSTITGEIFILNYLMEGLHVAFFLMAIPVCLIGFLVGVIGSIVFFIKKRNRF